MGRTGTDLLFIEVPLMVTRRVEGKSRPGDRNLHEEVREKPENRGLGRIGLE